MSDAVAEEVSWLIAHLRTMVAANPAAWARHENLTLRQLTALHFIRADSSLTLTGLANALGTRLSATCAMVDRLADAGMVRRVPVLEHGSQVQFKVNAEAVEMLGDIDTRTAQRLQAVLEMLSSEQQHAIAVKLGELVWQRLTSLVQSGRRSRVR